MFQIVSPLYFVELFAATEKMGIKINEAKTKYRVTGSEAPGLRQNITMEECNFEVIKDFKYLGSVLTADNEVRIEVNERLTVGSRRYNALSSTSLGHQRPKFTESL